VVICTTAIGARNTCATGNLRPGAAVLTIVGVVVPDNIGTYEVTLNDGVTFADGSTYVSSIVQRGASANYNIVIPARAR